MKIKKWSLFPNSETNQSGQVFIEFLMLLLVLMFMSLAMLKTINTGVGIRWTELVKAITAPTETNITLR